MLLVGRSSSSPVTVGAGFPAERVDGGQRNDGTRPEDADEGAIRLPYPNLINAPTRRFSVTTAQGGCEYLLIVAGKA
jgi:hypothetical protein